MKTRLHLRVPVPIAVKYRMADKEQEYKSTTAEDISWGGVLLIMNQAPPMGTRFIMQFVLSEDNVSLELWGTAVRVRPGDGAVPNAVGVKFDPLDEDSRSLIQRLVDEEVQALIKNV